MNSKNFNDGCGRIFDTEVQDNKENLLPIREIIKVGKKDIQ